MSSTPDFPSYFSPVTPSTGQAGPSAPKTSTSQFIRPPTYSQRAPSSEKIPKARSAKVKSLNLGRFVERFSLIAIPVQSAHPEQEQPPFSDLAVPRRLPPVLPIPQTQRQTWVPTRSQAPAPQPIDFSEKINGLRRLQLCPWEEHDVEKAASPSPKKRRKICTPHRCLSVVLALLGTLLVVNLLVLDYKLLPLVSESVVVFDSTASASSAGSATASNYATCVALFQLTANSDPLSYPCRSCVPILSSNQEVDAAVAALQFCALSDIYMATSDQSNASSTVGGDLRNARWMSDAQYCNWGGVACDEDQRVSNLTLVAPAVPSSLPATFSLLGSSLTALTVVGDGVLPSGPLFSSFWPEAKRLKALHLESTGLQAVLPDDLFRRLDQLESYTLINNAGLSNVVPESIQDADLHTIILSDQPVGDSSILDRIASSANLRKSLTYLDLSRASLAGPMPDLAAFDSLDSLSLASNDLSSLPDLPQNLTTLRLNSNPSLVGELPPSVCQSNKLTSCSITGTSVQRCGACH